MSQSSLYEHEPYPYEPMNANDLHADEHAHAGFNQRLALFLTRIVGTMPCAYVFALLAVFGIPTLTASAQQWVQWVSQTFVQLVMLSVIMVGQAVLGRKQELEIDESFHMTLRTCHELAELHRHFDAQDTKILALEDKMLLLLQRIDLVLEQQSQQKKTIAKVRTTSVKISASPTNGPTL